MTRKVNWGILGAAKIAVGKVIPAMQGGAFTQVTAIASRDVNKAKHVAEALGIPKYFSSYEDLLADGDVEAIYNPLPNHLHVPWTKQAAEAGKHVLCEKPIALTADEARELVEVRDRTGVKIQEAFMIRSHPQWVETRRLIRDGAIGNLRSIAGFFSYYNADPDNIRNLPTYGGGGLMDIGCYPINTSRFVFGEEPKRVIGLIETDPKFGVDRLTSAVMDFPSGQATFTCSTQLVPYQRMLFFGTRGRIEIEIPFNAPPDSPCRILLDDGSDLRGGGVKVIELPVCNQYTIQGDLFSRAILDDTDQVLPLEDSIKNMAVIDGIFRSVKTNRWEVPQY